MNCLQTQNGTKTLVDADIAEKYSELKLWLRKGYVSYDENHKTKKLHRLVISALVGQEVDHINRDKLDNRRENLRICTRAENIANRVGWGRVPIKGISFDKARNKYQVHKYSTGKSVYIGRFKTLAEAKLALELSI